MLKIHMEDTVKRLPLLIILFLVACTNTPQSMPTSSPEVALSPTMFSTATPILPTLTATPALPVNPGTPIPFELPTITNENADQISEILRWESKEPVVMKIIETETYDVYDTNRGVLIKDKEENIVTVLPPAKVNCSKLQSYNEFDHLRNKVFVSEDQRVGYLTNDGVVIYTFQGELLHSFQVNEDYEGGMCGVEMHYRFSTDLRWLAISYGYVIPERPVFIYDVNTGEVIASTENAYMAHLFTPDGKYLIVQDLKNRILVYETEQWSLFTSLTYTTNNLYPNLAISPNSQYLVAYPPGGYLTYYHLLSGQMFILGSVKCDSVLYCGVDVFFSKDEKQLGVRIIYPEYFPEGTFFTFDLFTGSQIENQDSYNPELWDEAIHAIEYFNDGRLLTDMLIQNLDFIHSTSAGTEGFASIMDITEETIYLKHQSNDIKYLNPQNYQMCLSMRDGEAICAVLPPIQEWKGIEPKSISFPFFVEKYNGEVSVRCKLLPDMRPDCKLWFYAHKEGDLYKNLASYSLRSIYNADFFSQKHYCEININGDQKCEFSSADTMFVDSDGSVYTFSRIESEKFELRRIGIGIPLVTIKIEPNSKVLWFRVMGDEKYLVYAVMKNNHVQDISIYLANMDGKILKSQDVLIIQSLTTSSDGRYFAFFGAVNRALQGFVWDVENLSSPVFSWSTSSFNSDAVVFTPDNTHLVYVERIENIDEPWKQNGAIQFYNIENRVVEMNINVELLNNGINTMSFSPDGNLLAAGLNDGAIWLFDVKSGSQIVAFDAHYGQVKHVEFSQNGKFLLSSGMLDDTTKIWGIYP